MLLRQFIANKNKNNNENKFRLCLKQLKPAKLRQHFRYRIWLCTIQIAKFAAPIDIKSMDDIPNVHENDKQTNKIEKADEQASFDGSENSYARLQNHAYYHSQVATGDPIRSKRIKRMQSKISHRTKIQ